MSIKSLVRGALVACLLALPTVGWSTTSVSTTVTVTETVDTFAEWDAGTGTATLNVADHITDTAAHSGNVTLHLFTNANTSHGTVSVAAAPVADANTHALGILTNTAGTVTLTTSFKLTGAGLDAPDGSYKPADTSSGDFFAVANTYILNDSVTDGDYAITLNVQAQAAANTVPPADTYTCAISLTASW